MGDPLVTGTPFDDVVRALAARDVAVGDAAPYGVSLSDCRVDVTLAGVACSCEDTDEWASVQLKIWHPEGAYIWVRSYDDVRELWQDMTAAHEMLEARRLSEAADLAFIVGPAPQDIDPCTCEPYDADKEATP